MARFDDIKAVFWSDGDYGVHLPPTDAMVADAERVLGVLLPSSLVEVLRGQNGGVVSAARKACPSRPTSRPQVRTCHVCIPLSPYR